MSTAGRSFRNRDYFYFLAVLVARAFGVAFAIAGAVVAGIPLLGALSR